jgi:hypothetical protein
MEPSNTGLNLEHWFEPLSAPRERGTITSRQAIFWALHRIALFTLTFFSVDFLIMFSDWVGLGCDVHTDISGSRQFFCFSCT